jgi:hypothetical protein
MLKREKPVDTDTSVKNYADWEIVSERIVFDKILRQEGLQYQGSWLANEADIIRKSVTITDREVDDSLVDREFRMRYYYTGKTYCVLTTIYKGNYINILGISHCNPRAKVKTGWDKVKARTYTVSNVVNEKSPIGCNGEKKYKSVKVYNDIDVEIPRYEFRSDQFSRKEGRKEARKNAISVMETIRGIYSTSDEDRDTSAIIKLNLVLPRRSMQYDGEKEAHEGLLVYECLTLESDRIYY